MKYQVFSLIFRLNLEAFQWFYGSADLLHGDSLLPLRFFSRLTDWSPRHAMLPNFREINKLPYIAEECFNNGTGYFFRWNLTNARVRMFFS